MSILKKYICFFAAGFIYSTSFALKDAQLQIPFNGTVVNPYSMITAVKPSSKYDGKNIICVLSSVNGSHDSTPVIVNSSNLYPNQNSSPDGLYYLVSNQSLYVYKFDIRPETAGYNTFIRFSNEGNQSNQSFLLSCKYG